MKRAAILAIGVLATWLAVFHVALFWQRIADSTISQPAVIMRWIASALVIGLAIAARRSLSRRRLALVFSLVVLLLHATIASEERLTANDDALLLIAIIAVPAFLVAAFDGECPIPLATTSIAVPITVFRRTFSATALPPRAPPAF